MGHETLQAAAIAAHHGAGIALAQPMGFLWLIPLFPLAGALVNALAGARLQARFGKRAVHFIAIGAMLLSSATAEVALYKLLLQPEERRFFRDVLWTMWQSGSARADLAFAVDPLGIVMTLIVTNVATLIHVYATGYMAEEPAYWRFFAWFNLFVFSMLLLVMGSNFAVMFFGWEGVGLCSWGLIGFWYEDPEKAKAGLKAFVVNRIGDFGFLIGLFLLFWTLSGVWLNGEYSPEQGLSGVVVGTRAEQPRALTPHGVQVGPTLELAELRNQIEDQRSGVAQKLSAMELWGVPIVALICILFFAGAAGKRAQIPLYVWLPDAMAGPTPVSALIHAATMVTAGVYLVARLDFLFALSPIAMSVVAGVGALTALFAASIGLFQHDIKKVLAYSTVSQLGFMFIGVGVGAYWAGIYHLLTHAFFKACLFLAAGSVILACHHEQDMRKMGGLQKPMPLTRWTYLVACVTIAGFPWASGFYSKDEILWKAWTAEGLSAPWLGHAIYLVAALAALGTSFYMFRSYYMTFTGEYRGGHSVAHSVAPADGAAAADAHAAADPHDGAGAHVPHESPRSMTWVLVALAFGSVAAIAFGWPAAWSGGHEPLLESFLAPSLPAGARVPFAEPGRATELLFQLFGFLIAAAGWFFARLLYADGRSPIPARLMERFKGAWTVVYNKYYVDELYAATVLRATHLLARASYWLDQNLVDALVEGAGLLGRVLAYADDALDRLVVDGAVDGVAALTRGAGARLRRVQTGQIQTYLYGVLAGALGFVVLQYVIR
jgi:NADH-quinone oxidoreductase subunit L